MNAFDEFVCTHSAISLLSSLSLTKLTDHFGWMSLPVPRNYCDKCVYWNEKFNLLRHALSATVIINLHSHTHTISCATCVEMNKFISGFLLSHRWFFFRYHVCAPAVVASSINDKIITLVTIESCEENKWTMYNTSRLGIRKKKKNIYMTEYMKDEEEKYLLQLPL